MKILFRIMILSIFLTSFIACDDEEETKERTLEVTPANLNGTWQLTEWNGQPLAEGTYCYITFVRKDKTFKMYQKFDSMYARFLTGSFNIEKDDYLGYIITGKYDYSLGGRWNNSYIVTELSSSGAMVWIVKDDADDVSKYIRCDDVPSFIKDESQGHEY
ncbi:lipocalin family protein [Bacteroides congonensis]|uniref:lipocalin family protein n=1 Tax=Bacteroides congonensis TaxID=1871006 RepID=UPI002FDB6F73